MHKDIQVAMQWRLAVQQTIEEDEDELMESASETDSPPTSPPGPLPVSPAGSPLRSQPSTPIQVERHEEEEEEQAIVEEGAPINRTQVDGEEEEDSEEKYLELSLRMEANMLENRAKQDLLHAWREAKEYKVDTANEAARYREAANRQLKKVEARSNTLRNASYTI